MAFNAIVFVLITGIAWRHLPRELGCSLATAHRRLQQWQRAGVWQKLYGAVLQRLEAGQIDRSTVAIGRAPLGHVLDVLVGEQVQQL